ncbi:MAG: hypothetical protein ACQCN6_11400 [Candidatus Bathyarchaeia archaeon]|jgi:hypothetical protein
MRKTKTLVIIGVLLTATFLSANIYSASATETQIWSGTAWSASDMRAIYGDSGTSSVLEKGKTYRIEVSEIFWYNFKGANLAADAMYYTTDPSDFWNWNSYNSAPDGHSFVQIDSQDVNWGPFSNGASGHTYSINYVGQGKALTFQIVDWIDGDYDNNYCHLPITIYLVPTTATGSTPGYWKNHLSAWDGTDYSPHQNLQSIFGLSAPSGSLLDALSFKGGNGLDGAMRILARVAVAAVLNANSYGANYPLAANEIVQQVSTEFSSGSRASILSLATTLDNYNNQLD